MKGSVDVAQTIRRYLNTRRGSMLVGGMNPLRGLEKADPSDEAILTDNITSSMCATVDPQPGQGDRSAQAER